MGNSSPDLVKRLRPIPYQIIVERHLQNSPPKGVHHQSSILGVELYHQRPKLVMEVLQGLSLILLHPEEIERDGGWSSVDYELLPKQCGELIE